MSLRGFFLGFLVAFLSTFMASCTGNGQTFETNLPDTLTYVFGSEPGNIDPHISNEDETAIILRQIYDTLVYRDSHQETIIPGLATKWTISPDNLVYTFSLRNGVKFHDGTLLNAQAVADNFDRIANLNPNTGKAGSLILKYYVGNEIIDEFTIRLKLSQPYAPFLDALSQPYLGIASPIAFKNFSSNRFQFHQVGTGPFMFVDYVPGKRIILQRNPEYKWGPAFYLPAQSNSAKEIEFLFMPTAKQRLESINSKKVDIVTNLLPNDARALTVNSNVRIVSTKIAGQPLQFLINTSRFPTDNVSFRQALLYSANRNFILDTIFQRFSSIGWTPITSNMPYYNGQLEGAYAGDTGRAQALLASIGYQDTDNNKYLDLGGVEAAITVVIQSGDLYPDIARDLTEQWQLFGIKANVVAVPTVTALKARVDTNDYNLVAFSMTGTDPALLNEFFAPDAPFNWSKVSDAQLATLLNQGIAQTDSTGRLNAYAQLQQQIMDQALILPIGEPTRLDAVAQSIQQLDFDSLGVPLLNNVIMNG
jgi:peptide/nickel transport system substrate-binding protein